MSGDIRGTRDRPIHITSHDDMFEAVRRVEPPTPAQARAGNYSAAHIVVGGLPITIETPMGHVRSGTGPDGERWSVRMSADYGYVKRTEGADGDHVDVYLGPLAHGAEFCPVWVIDQCDADSKAFDEHKVMLGFLDVEHARHAYTAAFSDGRGPDRTGAVTRMSFDGFVAWLKSGRTKLPLNYRKSASIVVAVPSYGASTCSCGGSTLTTPTPAEKAASAATDPKTMGLFARMFGTAIKNMPAADRTAFMADAAALTSDALGKSRDIVEGGGYESTGVIEDQWDGPPDDDVKVGRHHGPDSKAPSGTVPVGPGQAASGNGAEKMEREYSRHAPQSGVQRATEKLGEDIMGIRKAMKSLFTVVDGLNMQIETLKSTTAVAPPEADLKTMISKAVAEALAPLTKSIGRFERQLAVVKAEKESSSEKKEEKEEEDDEADEAEAVKAAEVEVENEVDDEDDDKDDDKESAKAAAVLRLAAKSRIKYANRRIRKAVEFIAEDKPKAAALAIAKANGNIAKAVARIEEAKTLRKGVAGPSTETIIAAVAKAKKKLGEAQAENQDKWPASDDKKVGKSAVTSEDSGTVVVPSMNASLTKAVEEISLAAKGLGMMNASMADVMAALSGAKQAKTEDGQPLPPVYALAKSSVTDVSIREEQLTALLEEGAIDNTTFDRAHDVLAHARAGMPLNVVMAAFDRLPDNAKKILQPIQQAA